VTKISFYINNEAGFESELAIRKVFELFTRATQFEFEYAGRNAAGIIRDGKNTVSFMQAWPEKLPLSHIGYTQKWYDASGITEADIILNQQSTGFTTLERAENGKYYIEGVLAHEIGHLLGLEHDADTTSLMYNFKTPQQSKWNLQLNASLRNRLSPCVFD
jgi:hypothetical protein